MFCQVKRTLIQEELENPTERRLSIQGAPTQDELLFLSNFFELLESWDTREKSNVC